MPLLLKKNGRLSEWSMQFNNLAKYSGEILTSAIIQACVKLFLNLHPRVHESAFLISSFRFCRFLTPGKSRNLIRPHLKSICFSSEWKIKARVFAAALPWWTSAWRWKTSPPTNRRVAEGHGPSQGVGEVAAGAHQRRRVWVRRVSASNQRDPSRDDEIMKYGSFCTSSFEALWCLLPANKCST